MMIRTIIFCLLLLLTVVALGTAQTHTLETVPNPKQSRSHEYVSNPDRILSRAAVEQINATLGRLEDSTTAQVAVVCVNSIGDGVPKEFATALFRKWGLGYREKNNGLLVLVVKDQHRIEMETGYGLEGILPDAVCKRIQTTKMIPLAKLGDFDGAMVEGSNEIARLISQPEAAVEAFDKSKYQANQRWENSAIFMLFVMLVPVLLMHRLVKFLFRKKNSIAGQIEKTVAKTKWRWVLICALYAVGPLVLGFAVISMRASLSLRGWQILLVMYGYVVLVVWDARRRRNNAFQKLFGAMTDPERYARRKAVRLTGWGDILLFPIPFGWIKINDDHTLNQLRDHGRQLADGTRLTKLDKLQKSAFLSDYQKVEEQLDSVEYDVWHDERHNMNEIIGYENLSNEQYQHCNTCKSRAMHLVDTRILTKATKEREGMGVYDYECKACGHHRETQYSIPMVIDDTPSPTSSSTTYSSSGNSFWGGSSGGSSSSSSWGGGSSGGGGSGSSW